MLTRQEICEVFWMLEHDWNIGGWLQERPSNQRRKEAISVQLYRIVSLDTMRSQTQGNLERRHIHSFSNGGFRLEREYFEDFSDEQKCLYHRLEVAWGLVKPTELEDHPDIVNWFEDGADEW